MVGTASSSVPTYHVLLIGATVPQPDVGAASHLQWSRREALSENVRSRYAQTREHYGNSVSGVGEEAIPQQIPARL